jgi:hypothetical protein
MFSSANRRAKRGLLAAACGVICLAAAAPAGAADSSFVVGDQSATMGAHVEFWGAQWWKLNSLSGGNAPAAFKGFANELAETKCGSSWTTDPGNSSDPPQGPLPGLIEAIASSHVTKAGRTISGDVTAVVLIATEPGYGPNPGHAGTGTVVGVGCASSEEEHETSG